MYISSTDCDHTYWDHSLDWSSQGSSKSARVTRESLDVRLRIIRSLSWAHAAPSVHSPAAARVHHH